MPHNATNLQVLQKAHAMAVAIHALADRHRQRLSARSPTLRAQMLRAADAIVLNIAEGAGKPTDRSFIYFLGIAIASSNELEAQLTLAADIHAFPAAPSAALQQVIEVRKMAIGLRTHLQKRTSQPRPR